MGQRLDLHSLLLEIIGNGNVYFQPPATLEMSYPAIVYSRDDLKTEFAGDDPYMFTVRYQVTVLDRNPDSEIPRKIAVLPMCTFSRYFAANGLNHDVYNLYY